MKLGIKKIDYIEALKLLIIRIIYTYLAVNVLSKWWYSGSEGYMISYNIVKDVVSFVIIVLETFFLHIIQIGGELKKGVVNFMFLIYFIPLNASTALNDMPYSYLIATSVYTLLFILALGLSPKGDNNSDLRNDDCIDIAKKSKMMNAFSIICIVFIIYKLSYNGLRLNLSLQADTVYSNRSDYAKYAAEIAGSFFAYAISLITRLVSYIAPIYLYYSLVYKKIMGVIVAIITILAEFSLSSGKAVLFFPVVVFFVFFIEKRRGNEIIKKINNVFLGLMIFCVFETKLTNKSYVYLYLIRRTMYIPAWLNALYYDFFSSNHKIYWSQNVFLLQKVLPHAYKISPIELISTNYFKGMVTSPNTGMFAEAFMHWGYFGILIYPMIYYFLFKFANKVFRDYGKGIAVIIGFDVALQMSNVPITRTDFVLSFILFTMFLWLIPKYHIKRAYQPMAVYNLIH